jgi:lipoprotein-anchoring transpeptidase ErfK/SrfK
MKRHLFLAGIALFIAAGINVQVALASGGVLYTVQPGDTFFSIAAGYGISVDDLLAANQLGWNTWISAGQQLVIPMPEVPQSNGALISTQTPMTAEAALYDFNPGSQPLSQPISPPSPWVGVDPNTPYPASTPPQPITPQNERWIDVNLTTQTLTAYEGQTPVYTAIVSTGVWQTPTVVGTFPIYVKYEKARMRGGFGADAYDLPDVPYVMYFYKDYGLHGTYWHNNFGVPMSHGCVNLSIPDSEWLFKWASVGTNVVTHY